MIMKVSIQIIIHSIMYFLLSFRIFSYGGVSGKKDFGFDGVKEIILELVEGVMNALQNNEVINVGNIAEPY